MRRPVLSWRIFLPVGTRSCPLFAPREVIELHRGPRKAAVTRPFEWGGQDSNLRPTDYESDFSDAFLPAETSNHAGQHWFHDSEDF